MRLLFRLKGLCVRDVGSNPTLTSNFNITMPKIKPIEKIYTDGSSTFCPAPVFSSRNFVYFSKDCLLDWLKSQSFYSETHLYKALMEKLNS